MNNLRVGRFAIPVYFIRNKTEVARAALRDMVVVRAEVMFCLDGIQYDAICDEFDEVPMGWAAPEYTIVLVEKPDGGFDRRIERGPGGVQVERPTVDYSAVTREMVG